MKFTEKDLNKEGSVLTLSKKDVKCFICGDITRYIDYCGECAICSSECMDEFNTIVDEQQRKFCEDFYELEKVFSRGVDSNKKGGK